MLLLSQYAQVVSCCSRPVVSSDAHLDHVRVQFLVHALVQNVRHAKRGSNSVGCTGIFLELICTACTECSAAFPSQPKGR